MGLRLCYLYHFYNKSTRGISAILCILYAYIPFYVPTPSLNLPFLPPFHLPLTSLPIYHTYALCLPLFFLSLPSSIHSPLPFIFPSLPYLIRFFIPLFLNSLLLPRSISPYSFTLSLPRLPVPPLTSLRSRRKRNNISAPLFPVSVATMRHHLSAVTVEAAGMYHPAFRHTPRYTKLNNNCETAINASRQPHNNTG